MTLKNIYFVISCIPKPILAHFSKKQSYLQFVLNQADYGKELGKIKHLAIDYS